MAKPMASVVEKDTRICNALSIDVEDYYQVSAFSELVDPSGWDGFPSRVVGNTERIMALLDKHGIKATFFVLGWVAERFPDLVRSINRAGHEIGSHGYSHQLIYRQTPSVFQEETIRSRKLLQDISGQPVIGYRAASYSITPQSRWALDIIYEAGFQYDSSLVPAYHDNYGMPGTPRWPYLLKTEKGKELVEFPISTLRFLGLNLPIAGGGYFRLYPYWFSRWGLQLINRQKHPFVFYLHPWEIDPEQPRLNAGWKSRFRHYNNLNKCYSSFERLLREFRFSTIEDQLKRTVRLLPDEISADTTVELPAG